MKKSNIILISIFVILLLTILIMQLKFKTHLKTIELNEIDLPLNAFNEIEAEQGWYIEVYNDPIMKVTISSDSIKDLISVDQNKLILNARKVDNKNRMIVKVYNPKIKQIKLSGNSRMYYYVDSIDSLNLNLYDKSNCVLTNKKVDNKNNLEKSKQGQINLLDISVSDKSRLNIYCDLKELKGELKDSSYCYVTVDVMINDFKKSRNARINSW